jgi:hypothetical protein
MGKDAGMPKMIGDPANVHIHDEGRRSHVKNSKTNDRVNFSGDDETQIQRALDYMKGHMHGQPGYDKCLKWFQKLGYT